MNKKTVIRTASVGLALFIFICTPALWAHAAEEIDAYCVVPEKAAPHGSTVALTIKFADSDKSNDFIVQGPFKILKYENGIPIIVDFKRGNDKDNTGKENPEKPTLAFTVTLSPKHKLPAPATESAVFTYFVKYKEGKRGKLFTTDREQQVDCSFTVQHEIEKPTTPSGGSKEDDTQKSIVPTDLNIKNIGTLPISRLYFLKEWRWSITRFFTFNPVAKADLELNIANEKAAEALKVREVKPDDAGAFAMALKSYTSATERLQARLTELNETSENPNVEKLLKKLDEQTLKHAMLFNQLAEQWNTDPYVEDASRVYVQGARDNHLQGAVDVVQKNIQELVVIAAGKDTHAEQKASDQIARAETAVRELESELTEFAINEPGVPNNTRAINTKGTGAVAKTGPVRLDPTPARISTNTTIERQTPKKDFGDRIKAGLETAGGMLANAKIAFANGTFGKAFGQARAAEMLARNELRVLRGVIRADTGELEDGIKTITPRSETMPIVPNTGDTEKNMAPEAEKRVFPETNTMTAPEAANRTVCDDTQAPGCLRGEILECHDGKWACIGPATGAGQMVNPTESPSALNGTVTDSNTLRQ